MNKILGGLCIVVLLAIPSQVTFAETEDATLLRLEGQLRAITAYVADRGTVWNSQRQTAVSDTRVRKSITDGVAWLVAAQEEDGHFAYEYLPYEDTYRADDNIVRQAGALYALSEVARRSDTDGKETNEAIERAIGFFERLSLEHEYEGTTVRCVTKSKESKVCKLGATTLALTGILGYVEAYPKKAATYKDLIEGYNAFIVKSKKPNAGFRDEYIINKGFKGENESSFSNGEALLALVRYYQYKEDDVVKKVIDDTFNYLKETEFDTPLYLWIMASLKDMQRLWPNTAYTQYGTEYTNWRIQLLNSSHNTTRNYCASTEGLASAHTLLEGSATPVAQKRLRHEIDFWNTKNLSMQIDARHTYRLVNQGGKFVFKEVENMAQSQGGFLTAHDELTQRIDFTQHCVSTYLQTFVDIDGKNFSL